MEYLRSRLFPRKPLKPLILAGLLTCSRSSAFPLKTVAIWYLNRWVKLTAAGLFRISTWFPFNPSWRNQNLDKCINNFSIGERKNIFFGKLSCLIFSKSFPKRIFWSKIVMPAECLNWMRKFLQTWQVEWCQRIFVGCKRHLFREPVLLNRRYVKQHRRQSC